MQLRSAPALRRLGAFGLDQVVVAVYLTGLFGLVWFVSQLGSSVGCSGSSWGRVGKIRWRWMHDGEGRPRIWISVPREGEPFIRILDENGEVVSGLP